MAGAPPLQRLGQQDLKDLREIKELRDRMPTGTGIATEIATGTRIRTRIATAMQALRHRVRPDNIRPRTPAEDGLASETRDLVRSASGRA